MRTRSLTAALMFLVLSSPLRAHDFWIEPSTFRPEVGSLVSARVFVGQDFSGDPLPRNEPHIVRFILAGPSGDSPMIGQSGRDPAGITRVASSGFLVLGYESNPSSVDLAGEKLQSYIKDEGLEPFFRGDTSKPIHDHFSRCAKSLVLAGDGGAHPKGYDRKLGFALEIIPEASPYALGKSGMFPVRLLQGGKPLAGALVVAMEHDQPQRKLSARTDTKGRASFNLPGPGVWLVKAVWVRPVPDKDDELDSYWASLTFEVPGSAPTAPRVSARSGNGS